jgi:hypothetical protein
MKITALILTSIVSFVISANAAISEGDVIAIDFGATATSTSNYNIASFSVTTIDDLVRLSDGASTGVSFEMTGVSQDNSSYVASSTSLGNTTDADIYEDGVIANTNASTSSTSITLTFTGLDDSLIYNLVGGSARPDDQNGDYRWVADWTADGQTVTAGTFADSGYITLSGLSSTDGTLVITVDGQDRYSPIAQVELIAIPEPSSFALLAGLTGVVSVMVRRRRS